MSRIRLYKDDSLDTLNRFEIRTVIHWDSENNFTDSTENWIMMSSKVQRKVQKSRSLNSSSPQWSVILAHSCRYSDVMMVWLGAACRSNRFQLFTCLERVTCLGLPEGFQLVGCGKNVSFAIDGNVLHGEPLWDVRHVHCRSSQDGLVWVSHAHGWQISQDFSTTSGQRHP